MDEISKQGSLFGTGKKEVKKESSIIGESPVSKEDTSPMCEIDEHSWRDAWLKNSTGTKHVVFCVGCNRTKYNEDGTLQSWLVEQRAKEE